MVRSLKKFFEFWCCTVNPILGFVVSLLLMGVTALLGRILHDSEVAVNPPFTTESATYIFLYVLNLALVMVDIIVFWWNFLRLRSAFVEWLAAKFSLTTKTPK